MLTKHYLAMFVIYLYCFYAVQLNPGLAFSLVPTENFSTEPVNFVAASEDIFNIWTDGINALLGKQVSNCSRVCIFDSTEPVLINLHFDLWHR